jgi:hypothetical protein
LIFEPDEWPDVRANLRRAYPDRSDLELDKAVTTMRIRMGGARLVNPALLVDVNASVYFRISDTPPIESMPSSLNADGTRFDGDAQGLLSRELNIPPALLSREIDRQTSSRLRD